MSIYNPNIPQANDDLSDSQGQILQNFNKADSSFGTDHYRFSDLTVNNGFHNRMTTPAFVDSPPTGLPPVTIANIPIMYAYQDSANVGVINYSRGPLNAVPTPLTHLQSTSAAIVLAPAATTNILDFTGLSRATCMIYAFDAVATAPGLGRVRAVASVFWSGTFFIIDLIVGSTSILTVQASGNILQLRNSTIAA